MIGNVETRRPAGGGGFSLFELVAVMVVVSVIAGAAVVSLSSTTGNRSTIAARQLQRDMTYARSRAVATGAPCWIAFDTTNHTWSVYAEDPSNLGRLNATVLVDPEDGDLFVQPLNTGQFVGVTMTGVNFDGEDWVGFDWLGRPLDKTGEATPLAADGTVDFSGGQTITVEKDTGAVAFSG